MPVDGLDKLATFVALLGGNELEMVVLHDSAGKPDQRLETVIREKLIRERHVLDYGMFIRTAKGRGSMPADVEDMLSPAVYLRLFNSAYAAELGGVEVKEGDLQPGNRSLRGSRDT